MKKQKLFFTIVFAFVSNFIFAQSSDVVRKYIDTYKDIAVAEELRTGVPAAITLAQGIHETSAGTSDLVTSSNNHFGIKCKSDWKGATVYHDDDAKGECFRKYDDPRDSYKDHSDFLKNRPNYALLFQIDPVDYKEWAYGLKKAGYATNPKYPQILIRLIEEYDLQQFTLLALNGKLPNNGDAVYAGNAKNNSANDTKTDVVKSQQAVMKTVAYPATVFEINKTKVVYVLKGTSFLKIASENNIDLSRLFDFNDMKAADIAANDQLVFLQRKRTVGTEPFHTVQEGETLYDIAQTEGIRLENLLAYNFLKYNMQPAAGEKMYLKEKAPEMPKLAVTK